MGFSFHEVVATLIRKFHKIFIQYIIAGPCKFHMILILKNYPHRLYLQIRSLILPIPFRNRLWSNHMRWGVSKLQMSWNAILHFRDSMLETIWYLDLFIVDSSIADTFTDPLVSPIDIFHLNNFKCKTFLSWYMYWTSLIMSIVNGFIYPFTES